MKNAREIIEMPLVSEKSTNLRAEQNKYVFRVNRKANKLQIKMAVQELFGVHVENVTTMMMHGRPKRLGRFEGRRPDWKKAVVKLKKGETIELFECNELVASYHSSPIGSLVRSAYWDESEFLQVDRRADEQVVVQFVIPHWERYYTSSVPRETLPIDPRVPNHDSFYYVRVKQKDGHIAWSSPIWLLCRVGECHRVKGYQHI